MGKTENGQKNFGYYAICVIAILLMFFGGMIPSFSPDIPKVGMQLLGVFVGMVLLWSTVGGVIWPSILAIIAFGMTDYTNVNAAVMSSLGQVVIWQVLMVIVLASTITVSGGGEFMARWVISRKFLKGRPYLFSGVFLVAMTLISSVTNAIAMMLLSWTILRGIADIIGASMKEKYFRMMSVLLMPACAFGEFTIPFRSWVGALWNTFGQVVGQQFDYIPYIVITLLLSVLLDILFVLYLKLSKVDTSKLKTFDNTEIYNSLRDTKLTVRQKAYMVTMLICMVVAILSCILPKTSGLYLFLNNTLTTGGIFGVGVVVLMVIRAKDGKPLMDFFEITAKSPIWGPFFIIASAIPIANALCAQDVGFLTWTGKVIQPIFAESSLFMIYFLIIIVAVFLTNLASNTGIAMMMLALAVPLAASAGANVYIVGICTIFSACMGFLLPGAGAISAAVYGMKEEQDVRVKDILSHGSVVCVLYIVVASILFPILDKVLIIA